MVSYQNIGSRIYQVMSPDALNGKWLQGMFASPMQSNDDIGFRLF
jgi:hypothetical protein